MAISLKRRNLLLALAASPLVASRLQAAEDARSSPGRRQGRLKQSVMGSVWGSTDLTFEERCELLSRMGFAGVDLPQPQQIPVLRDYGLAPTLMGGTGTNFDDGLIRRELHDHIEEATLRGIDTCAEVGCPNLIALPGNRRGMSHEEGRDNAIEVLSRVAPYAEEKGVVLCMEITNSKVEQDARTDQVFDHLDWGWEVCRGVGSPNVQIVFDIYHAQISDGDIVRNIRDHLDMICHIHVAGVPTRREIDGTQELNYRYIAEQIAEMGYRGYIAHEHRPAPDRNPLVSLAVGYDILTV